MQWVSNNITQDISSIIEDVLVFCLFFVLFYCTACWILVPHPEIEPGTTAVKAPSPNHWTAKEFPIEDLLDTLSQIWFSLLWMKKLTSLVSIAESVEPEDFSFSPRKVKLGTTTCHSHDLLCLGKLKRWFSLHSSKSISRYVPQKILTCMARRHKNVHCNNASESKNLEAISVSINRKMDRSVVMNCDQLS